MQSTSDSKLCIFICTSVSISLCVSLIVSVSLSVCLCVCLYCLSLCLSLLSHALPGIRVTAIEIPYNTNQIPFRGCHFYGHHQSHPHKTLLIPSSHSQPQQPDNNSIYHINIINSIHQTSPYMSDEQTSIDGWRREEVIIETKG